MPHDTKGMHSLEENMKMAEPSKKQKYYPSLHVSAKQLPGIKGKVGDTGYLFIKYKIASSSKYNNEPATYGLELMSGKVISEGDYE